MYSAYKATQQNSLLHSDMSRTKLAAPVGMALFWLEKFFLPSCEAFTKHNVTLDSMYHMSRYSTLSVYARLTAEVNQRSPVFAIEVVSPILSAVESGEILFVWDW